MKKRVTVVALLTSLVAVSLSPQVMPQPVGIILTISNATDRCVWPTLYFSKKAIMPWIEGFKAGQGQRYIKAGGSETFFQPMTDAAGSQIIPWQIRVRAEFMNLGACRNSVAVDTARDCEFMKPSGKKAAQVGVQLFLNHGKYLSVGPCKVKWLG